VDDGYLAEGFADAVDGAVADVVIGVRVDWGRLFLHKFIIVINILINSKVLI
jgi:hypothetical protein